MDFYIGTNDIIESNKFLNSLWREFNQELSPKDIKKDKRCPWAYFPDKQSKNGQNIIYFGNMRTEIGVLEVYITSKKKNSITQIYFEPDKDIPKENHSLIKSKIKGIIKRAKANINVESFFEFTAKIKGNYEIMGKNILISNCYGKYFEIKVDNEYTTLKYCIKSVDYIEASRVGIQKIDYILNFLSVETNLNFEFIDRIKYREISEEEYTLQIDEVAESYMSQCDIIDNSDIFVDDIFMDGYPSFDKKVLLSKEGSRFIDIIISTDIEQYEPIMLFLSSCYHFKQGLNNEYKMYNYDPGVVTQKKEHIDISITLYLSAIETTTLIGSNPIKCEECGQPQYKINQRVYNFINEYIDETHAKVFKKLYSSRSNYLHVGSSIFDIQRSYVRPLLDRHSSSGCIEYNGITVNVGPANIGLRIQNIREWSGYALRKFYRTELL